MRVTFDDVKSELVAAGGSTAQKRFKEWSTNHELIRAGVVNFVTRFDQKYIYELKRSELEEVFKKTNHPFEGISQQNPIHLEGITLVKDLDTPWSFMQLFHGWLRKHSRVPTWQEWRRWLKGDGAAYLWLPWCQLTNYEGSSPERQNLISLGADWRLGNLYYSALRELDILTALKQYKIELKYHILADALFAADFWINQKIVSVYIPNEEYKKDGKGRKLCPDDFLLKSAGFECREFKVERRDVGGKYWIVDSETIDKIRAFIEGPVT